MRGRRGVTRWSAGVRGVGLAGLLAVALLVPAGTAAAGQDPGIRLGYYGGADADDPVPAVGIYGRFDLPGPLNLEISADYRTEKMRGGDLESRVIPVRASAVLNLLPGVSPYLLAGVGADFDAISFHRTLAGTADVNSVLYEAHAGVGLEVSLGPLSVVADLRYCAVTTVDAAAVKAALGHAYDPSGWYASLSAGISF